MRPIRFSGEYGIVYKVSIRSNGKVPSLGGNDKVLQAEQRIREEAKRQKVPISIRVDDFVEADKNGQIKSISQGLAVFTGKEKKSYDDNMVKARVYSVVGFLLPAFISKGIQTVQQALKVKTLDFDAADSELEKTMKHIQSMVKDSPLTTENMQDGSGKLTFDLETGEKL